MFLLCIIFFAGYLNLGFNGLNSTACTQNVYEPEFWPVPAITEASKSGAP